MFLKCFKPINNIIYDYIKSIFRFFFESELVGVTAFSFSAIEGFRWQSSITFSTNFFFTIVFFGKGGNGGFHGSSFKFQIKGIPLSLKTKWRVDSFWIL
jgi:hypothetical protein